MKVLYLHDKHRYKVEKINVDWSYLLTFKIIAMDVKSCRWLQHHQICQFLGLKMFLFVFSYWLKSQKTFLYFFKYLIGDLTFLCFVIIQKYQFANLNRRKKPINQHLTYEINIMMFCLQLAASCLSAGFSKMQQNTFAFRWSDGILCTK